MKNDCRKHSTKEKKFFAYSSLNFRERGCCNTSSESRQAEPDNMKARPDTDETDGDVQRFSSLQYAGGGRAAGAKSVARNSLEGGMAGPMVHWEDETDPGLEGAGRVERVKIDDRID